ncbi:ATP-binding protein [Hydrogenophaga pseudoflava]|nr:winged helix-turn-helix domain-containing protein [Hydrogenophaga pseudoflava]
MDVLQFGRFEIRPEQRQVRADGVPVPLGSRALDLLLLLVRHRDRVVGKDEIFSQVWPGLVVEENNLSVQIYALRRLLGTETIGTVTGRGYRFTAQVRITSATAETDEPRGNLPARRADLFGREAELAHLLTQCERAACITLCGMAGVGKTALATLVAQRLADLRPFADGAWRVDLTEVRDPAWLVPAVAEVVGVELDAQTDALKELVAQLRHRQLLLVLDNCEHVIEAAAQLVQALLATTARVMLITTSQEPLRVSGETVVRLDPLVVPHTGPVDDAADCGAMRMLVARVRAAMGGSFAPMSGELADMVEICRQLDGIPLALEFAASRVPLLGVSGVRSRLNDRLRLLVGGARGAPKRHRSLQAALEWSHQLLSPRTQGVLHRLAVFPSGFSIEGAQLIADTGEEAELLEQLDILVDRSLVVRDAGPRARYRILETTRAFALDCLAAAGGGIDWQARLAQVMAELCVTAARRRDTAWMWQEMPNLRAAFSWATAATGPGATAVTLATYASVVLGAGGALSEALNMLRLVSSRLDESCPPALVARYWHWLGRLGVEGRLPSSTCIEALQRADALFAALNEPRHRHACQRHLAEAELRSGHPDRAEQHLASACDLEKADMSPADRMRRQRVQALLASARGRHTEALRLAHSALELAEGGSVDRYRLLLMADIGWTHLQMGQAASAVGAFRNLLLHLDHSIRQGLARARALSGLTAALVAAGQVDDAARVAGRTVHALQQANLLCSRCEVFAWLLAAKGNGIAAAQLIGAGDAFTAGSETERDPISQLARARTMALLEKLLPADDTNYWQAQGAISDENHVRQLLERAFVTPPQGDDFEDTLT